MKFERLSIEPTYIGSPPDKFSSFLCCFDEYNEKKKKKQKTKNKKQNKTNKQTRRNIKQNWENNVTWLLYYIWDLSGNGKVGKKFKKSTGERERERGG